jgi:hypothetical protein
MFILFHFASSKPYVPALSFSKCEPYITVLSFSQLQITYSCSLILSFANNISLFFHSLSCKPHIPVLSFSQLQTTYPCSLILSIANHISLLFNSLVCKQHIPFFHSLSCKPHIRVLSSVANHISLFFHSFSCKPHIPALSPALQTIYYLKNVVFWDVALCRSCVNRRFGGTYRLHLQGRTIRERRTCVARWLQTEPPVGNNQLYKKWTEWDGM